MVLAFQQERHSSSCIWCCGCRWISPWAQLCWTSCRWAFRERYGSRFGYLGKHDGRYLIFLYEPCDIWLGSYWTVLDRPRRLGSLQPLQEISQKRAGGRHRSLEARLDTYLGYKAKSRYNDRMELRGLSDASYQALSLNCYRNRDTSLCRD